MVAYGEYRFYDHPNFFVLEPLPTSQEKSGVAELIIFHRDAGSIELSSSLPKFHTEPTISVVYGLVGVIRLVSGDHLIVATEKELAGELMGHSIFQIKATKLYSFARNHSYLTPEQAADEEHYRNLLNEFLGDATLYYSNTLDLTRKIQSQKSLLDNKFSPDGTSLIAEADKEFFWNQFHLQPFLDITKADSSQNFSNFFVPIIYGYVKFTPVTINGTYLVYGLITRRGTSRVGTRYFSRGVDSEGNVSNFAETEQILSHPQNGIASFVQIRGSIPIFWAQITNTKYTPKLVIEDRPETSEAFQKHFQKMTDNYGSVVAVNLINTKGYELPMGQKFAQQAQLLENTLVTYVHFDFHQECSKMRWHRIQLLIDQLAPHIDEQGYFLSGVKLDSVDIKQSGVIRTNCMDCLDRTNVVQSMIAKHVLNQQLKAMRVVSTEHTINEFSEDFAFVFRNMWADNADAVSIAYSGTGALKTDFTRTGKRTVRGPLQDGVNSIVRYVKNNYLDGSRQDGFDLFLGRYQVCQANPSPFQSSANWRVQLALGLFFSGLAIFFSLMCGLIPSRFGLVVGLGFSLILSSVRLVVLNGADFVDRPHLVKFEYDRFSNSSENHHIVPVEKNQVPPVSASRLAAPVSVDRSKAD